MTKRLINKLCALSPVVYIGIPRCPNRVYTGINTGWDYVYTVDYVSDEFFFRTGLTNVKAGTLKELLYKYYGHKI